MKSEKPTKGPVKGSEIILNLINGAEKACLEYIKISGRPSPGYAPESFIQAGAARALQKVGQTLVVLEESVADTYIAARPPTPGRIKNSVSKGRYDIVAYWKNGKPRAAIEVKSPINTLVKQKFYKDFNRLIETINSHPDTKFQYGIFLFLTVKKGGKIDYLKANSDIDKFVERLGIEATSLINEKSQKRIKAFLYEGKTHALNTDDFQGAWRISAIVFKR